MNAVTSDANAGSRPAALVSRPSSVRCVPALSLMNVTSASPSRAPL
jgi:hypothetical protein